MGGASRGINLLSIVVENTQFNKTFKQQNVHIIERSPNSCTYGSDIAPLLCCVGCQFFTSSQCFVSFALILGHLIQITLN